MTNLNILSWNVNGLNGPHKRACCLELLKRRKIDLALIQETHLKKEDVHRCNNKFYKVISASSATDKTKGVMILLRRNLRMDIIEHDNDTDGRIAHVKALVGNRKVAFLSVYAPSTYDPAFFSMLTNYLLNMAGYEIVLGSDMNAVMSHEEDRSGESESHLQAACTDKLRSCISALSLVDSWRFLNVTAKAYTFYSSRHKSYSRIDFIFISCSLSSSCQSSDICPMSLSDHDSNVINLKLINQPPRAPRWRFNPTLLRDENFCKSFKTELLEFISINQGTVADPRILWDAVKGFIRNFSISFASHLKKSRMKRIADLESQLKILEGKNQASFSEQMATKIRILKTELNQLLRVKAEFLIQRTRQNYYFNGSRPSHLLALQLRNNEKYANIPAIRLCSGELTNDQQDINNAFQSFYSNLYTSESTCDNATISSFLSSLNLPTLSTDESETLGQPITLQELKESLKPMNKGKSPGLDGIPIQLNYIQPSGQSLVQYC